VISAPPTAGNPPTPLNFTATSAAAPATYSSPSTPATFTTTLPPIPIPTPTLHAPPITTPQPPTTPTTATTSSPSNPNKPHKQKLDPSLVRSSAGSVWVDKTLTDFPPNDFRIFVGDLGIEVNDTTLAKTFEHYASFAYARVVRDRKTALSRGFGFVSLLDHEEGVRALKEMQGKYCGNRPMALKRGQWQKRSLETQKTRNKHLF